MPLVPKLAVVTNSVSPASKHLSRAPFFSKSFKNQIEDFVPDTHIQALLNTPLVLLKP